MAVERITNKVLLAVACSLVLVLVPARSAAQGGVLSKVGQGIKKGAEGVEKGVEAGVQKTKGGVESVGHKTKRAVTHEDNTSADQQKPTTQSNTPTETTSVVTGEDNTSADRQKPVTQSTTPSETTSTESATSKSTTSTKSNTEGTKGGKHLPGTAGELPLLAVVGSLALASAVALKLIRRTQ